MRLPVCFLLPALLLGILSTGKAQSVADQKTLEDLKMASRQMQMETAGMTPFRMEATFETSDFMGRADNQGHWTEEFATMDARRRTIREASSAENYAPEDQESIGATAAPSSGNFMQRFLVREWLLPGPSDVELMESKLSFKTQKVGMVSLRCVTLAPKDAKTNDQKRMLTRVFCLDADRPIIRLKEAEYGIVVTYNSIAHFGSRVCAQTMSATQFGRQRGKLQVTKLVGAPELLQANLVKPDAPPVSNGFYTGAKVDQALTAGAILKKVTPIYPEGAKQKHVSGSVILRAIISKQGTIESLEVLSAPEDDLAEAAVEAASQWVYKPYLLNGKPTEVDTTITVNFRMS